MICSNCDDDIEVCDHCNTEFEVGDEVICSEGCHIHEDCFNTWLQDTTNWEKGEVLDE